MDFYTEIQKMIEQLVTWPEIRIRSSFIRCHAVPDMPDHQLWIRIRHGTNTPQRWIAHSVQVLVFKPQFGKNFFPLLSLMYTGVEQRHQYSASGHSALFLSFVYSPAILLPIQLRKFYKKEWWQEQAENFVFLSWTGATVVEAFRFIVCLFAMLIPDFMETESVFGLVLW